MGREGEGLSPRTKILATAVNLVQLYQLLFTKFRDMTDADKGMNPEHFGSYLADTQIRISLEIRIRIQSHFRLRLDALAEVCSLSDFQYGERPPS